MRNRVSLFVIPSVLSLLVNLVSIGFAEAEPTWKSREQISKTVKQFYSEYIGKAKRPKDQKTVLEAHLTPDFLRGFPSLVEGMDADPVVRAEHWGIDYRYKIRVYNISVSGEDTARADVRLGEIPQGVKSPSGPVTLRVNLKKVGEQWRISSIDRGFDNP